DKTISVSGIASINLYLRASLGITSYDVLSYLTETPPTSMQWLTAEDAKRLGIDVKPFSISHDEWRWARSAFNAPPLQRVGTYLLGAAQSDVTPQPSLQLSNPFNVFGPPGTDDVQTFSPPIGNAKMTVSVPTAKD